MTFYQKNLAALSKHNAGLVASLQNVMESGFAVRLQCGPTGSTWQWQGGQGLFVSGSTQGLATLEQHKRLYVLYGIGDGEFFNRLRQHEQVDELLVFEPSITLFKDLLTQVDLGEGLSDPKVRLIIGEDHRVYIRAIEAYLRENIDRFCFAGHFGNLITPGVEKIPGFADHCARFAEAFKGAVQNVRVEAKYAQEDSYYGLMNSLENYREYRKYSSIQTLSGLFDKLPAVVVTTGPSLKESLPYLQQIQDLVVLICCDSALPLLVKNGITPHLVCTLERVLATQRYFSPGQQIPTALVAPCVVSPQTFKAHAGQKFSILRDNGFDAWLFPDQPRFFLGQTVSQLALQVAFILRPPCVYLVGVDCALDPDTGESHHSETDALNRERHQQYQDEGLFQVVTLEGYDGEKKQTMTHWFVDSFIIAEMILRNNIEVKRVSPVKYGIPISHTHRVDPQALGEMATHPAVDVFALIKGQGNTVHAHETRGLKEALTALQSLQDFAADTLAMITGFYYQNMFHHTHNTEVYTGLFADLNKRRSASTRTPSFRYQETLHNILQGIYAETGHHYFRAFAEILDPIKRVDEQLMQHRRWFTDLIVWGERVQHLIQKSGGVP